MVKPFKSLKFSQYEQRLTKASDKIALDERCHGSKWLKPSPTCKITRSSVIFTLGITRFGLRKFEIFRGISRPISVPINCVSRGTPLRPFSKVGRKEMSSCRPIGHRGFRKKHKTRIDGSCQMRRMLLVFGYDK